MRLKKKLPTLLPCQVANRQETSITLQGVVVRSNSQESRIALYLSSTDTWNCLQRSTGIRDALRRAPQNRRILNYIRHHVLNVCCRTTINHLHAGARTRHCSLYCFLKRQAASVIVVPHFRKVPEVALVILQYLSRPSNCVQESLCSFPRTRRHVLCNARIHYVASKVLHKTPKCSHITLIHIEHKRHCFTIWINRNRNPNLNLAICPLPCEHGKPVRNSSQVDVRRFEKVINVQNRPKTIDKSQLRDTVTRCGLSCRALRERPTGPRSRSIWSETLSRNAA